MRGIAGRSEPREPETPRTRPIYTCKCGAQSTSPIDHDHSRLPRRG